MELRVWHIVLLLVLGYVLNTWRVGLLTFIEQFPWECCLIRIGQVAVFIIGAAATIGLLALGGPTGEEVVSIAATILFELFLQRRYNHVILEGESKEVETK